MTYPTPRTAAEAARIYAQVERTEGRAAADQLDAAWQRELDDAADRAIERFVAAHDRLGHDGTGCGCLDAVDELPEVLRADGRLR